MTNKEIFNVCYLISKALKNKGVIPNVESAKQTIYDTLAPIIKDTKTTDTKEKEWFELAQGMKDGELRTRVKALLLEKLDNKTLGANDIAQLTKVFGLADATSDLTIEVVNYADSCPECARRDEQNEQKPQ